MIKSPVHILGIGGIGTSALAQWLQRLGLVVTGSDATSSDITAALVKTSIPVTIGDTSQLPLHTATLIYTDAAPLIHPLRQQATRQNITQLSYAEALGELTRPFKTIAIAGSHGKSTTTALAGLVAEAAGLDPTVVVGTRVPAWQTAASLGNFRPGVPAGQAGQSQWCIVEADEYRNHFHYLAPTIAVITSLDHDHVDAFPTPDDYQRAFVQFIRRLSGRLVIEQAAAASLAVTLPANTMRYSLTDSSADLYVNDLILKNNQHRFTVVYHNQAYPNFSLPVPGQHMVANALAAIGAILATGTETSQVITAARTALAGFTGTWRRFEFLREINGALAFSDYAHHPTELAALLQSAHAHYPGRRLLLVFQPHHGDRTRAFAAAFLTVLQQQLEPDDHVILCPIYGVLGREHVSSDDPVAHWVQQLRRRATRLTNLNQLSDTVQASLRPGDIVLFTGAGTIDQLARQIK